jgi:2-oxoglutarate ferredoxin oxidoreductase subunit alpha
MANQQTDTSVPSHPLEIRESVTIRLAGDSGDGMQLVGSQFTHTSALLGNDISTLPDFPAEIRAPAGTLSGVSGFQIHFSSTDIHTPGDELDALVAMNPAALKTNLRDLQKGGILIVNRDAFVSSDLAKANYTSNPLEDGSLSGYRVFAVPITTLNREAVAELKLSTREADRCKNFFALGLVYWLYERSLEPTQRWLQNKFSKNPAILEANLRSLRAGYHYGETTEAMVSHFSVPKAKLPPGLYRKLTGNEAIALGLVAAAERAGLPLVFAGYPITPASDILQALSELSRFGVKTLQAEDEIAAMGAAIGAAFGGSVGSDSDQWPRHLLEIRRHGAGGHDRIARGHHRRATRRAEYGLTDQDRASGSLASDVRSQWRVSAGGNGPGHAGRLLCLRLRGGSPGHSPHDSGSVALGRLPSQRCRTLVDSPGR